MLRGEISFIHVETLFWNIIFHINIIMLFYIYLVLNVNVNSNVRSAKLVKMVARSSINFHDLVSSVPSSFISTVIGNLQRNRGMAYGRIFRANQSIIYF